MWHPVCDYINLDPKIESEEIIMEIKNVNKFEELRNHEWKHKEKEFILEYKDACIPALKLIMKNFIGPLNHKITALYIADISKENLVELELYGLKVNLNEGITLTRKERNFLECFGEYQNVFIVRFDDGLLRSYDDVPEIKEGTWECESADILDLSDGIFDFISWESGKAWSKAELLELEVVD